VNPPEQRFPDAIFPALARYNRWMNERIYAVAATLSSEQRRRDLGAFFGSVHLTLTHLLICDRAWLARLRGDREEYVFCDPAGQRVPVLGSAHDIYPDFDVLTRERNVTDDRICAWVADLGTNDLQAMVEYKDTRGTPYDHAMWWALLHMFNHQTHHRGQVTTLLKQLGADPGVTDLIAMLRGTA
jgi:uncharacterized damage-inducible protein DinB